jgi:hypothetical protein
LAYRWFSGLSIEDKIPDHSTFSRARNERFRDSGIQTTEPRAGDFCNKIWHTADVLAISETRLRPSNVGHGSIIGADLRP